MKDFKTLLAIGECGKIGLDYPCTKEFLEPLLVCNDFFGQEIINQDMLIDYLSNYTPAITFKQRKEWLLTVKSPILESVLTRMNDTCLVASKQLLLGQKTETKSDSKEEDLELVLDIASGSDGTLMNQFTSGFDFKFNYSKDVRHVLSVELVFPRSDLWFEIKRRKLNQNSSYWNTICKCLSTFCERFDNIDKEIYAKHQDSSTCNNVKFICGDTNNLHSVGFDIAMMIYREIVSIESKDYLDLDGSSGSISINIDDIDHENENENDDEIILFEKRCLFEKLIFVCFDCMCKCKKKYKNAYHWYEKIIPLLPPSKVQDIFTRMTKNNMIDGNCSYPCCYDCKWTLFLLFIENGTNNFKAELKKVVQHEQFIQFWLWDIVPNNTNIFVRSKKEKEKECIEWWIKYFREYFDKDEITSIIERLLNIAKKNNISVSFDVLTLCLQLRQYGEAASKAVEAISKLLLRLVVDSADTSDTSVNTGNNKNNPENAWKWIKMCLDKGYLGEDDAAMIFARLGTNSYTHECPIKKLSALIRLNTLLFKYCDFQYFIQMKSAIEQFMSLLIKWSDLANDIKQNEIECKENNNNKVNVTICAPHMMHHSFDNLSGFDEHDTYCDQLYNRHGPLCKIANQQCQWSVSNQTFPIDKNQLRKSLECCTNILFQKSTPEQLEQIFLPMFRGYIDYRNRYTFKRRQSQEDRLMRLLYHCGKDCDLSSSLTDVMYGFIELQIELLEHNECQQASKFEEWFCSMVEQVLRKSEVSKLALYIGINLPDEKLSECMIGNCDISILFCNDVNEYFVKELAQFLLKRKDSKFQTLLLKGLEKAGDTLSTKKIEQIATLILNSVAKDNIVINEKLIDWVNDTIGAQFVFGRGVTGEETMWPSEA